MNNDEDDSVLKGLRALPVLDLTAAQSERLRRLARGQLGLQRSKLAAAWHNVFEPVTAGVVSVLYLVWCLVTVAGLH